MIASKQLRSSAPYVATRAILNELAELGPRRYTILVRATMRYPVIVRRALARRPDRGVGAYVVRLAPFVALSAELRSMLGDTRGIDLARRVTQTVAVAIQRSLYHRVRGRPLETFADAHAVNRTTGLFRYIEYADITRTPDRYGFTVTRCRFFDAFTLMGAPWLTEAFCRSDEIVFNELAPAIRFRRLPVLQSTIGRGGTTCSFQFKEFKDDLAS